jgi:heme exporter protein B
MTDFRRYLGTVWQIFRKDIQVEWRGRQGVPVMLVFSLLVVFLFNFALQLSPQLQSGLASGLLWVTLAFAATLGLNRSAALERENDALKGLMLAPVDRSAIFFGKALSNSAFTLLVAFILMPIISLFFNQNLLLIAASEASRGILSGQSFGELQNWLYLLLGCGILFTAAGLLLFETILEE